MPDNRRIDVVYRDGVIKNVQVSSLYHDAGVRFWSAVKSAAIAQKLLEPLPVEGLLGFADVTGVFAGTQVMKPLSSEVVLQVTLCC